MRSINDFCFAVRPRLILQYSAEEGRYVPYYDKDPYLLVDLLCRVKAEVHPWIRLNRVIRDIPEVSIVAGNSNTNLRQVLST
ncbi:unnamed protein product, partial [Prorocentrum cordatum]